jgi:putative glutamine amidotransferase
MMMRKPVIGIGSDIQSNPGKRDQAFAYTTYVEALKRAGAVPVLIPPQPENVDQLISGLDGVLLAGGEDFDPSSYGEKPHETVEPMDPRRQSNDLALARRARERGIPTLGICLGLQAMNVAAGGSLIQDIDSHVDTDIEHASVPEDRARHHVMVEQGSRLSSILSSAELDVNSSHHQAIKDVGEGLRVTAHAPDGIVEGLEDPGHPFYLGVQWHPEDMNGETSASELFGAFVKAAREHAQKKENGATELSPAGTARSE